jgi:hypothetical protein
MKLGIVATLLLCVPAASCARHGERVHVTEPHYVLRQTRSDEIAVAVVSETGEPQPGAEVLLIAIPPDSVRKGLGPTWPSVTDARGVASFTGLLPGTYRVQVTCPAGLLIGFRVPFATNAGAAAVVYSGHWEVVDCDDWSAIIRKAER